MANVRPDGKIEGLEVRRGLGLGLDEAAVAAVRQWQFTVRGSSARAFRDVIEVPFELSPAAPWSVGGWTFRRSDSGNRFHAISLTLAKYVAPDPAACQARVAYAPVYLEVRDDGTTTNVRPEQEDTEQTIAGAVVKAVQSWRFQPMPRGTKRGTTSGIALLECRRIEGSKDTSGPVPSDQPKVSEPRVIFKIDPPYSEAARHAKFSGNAVLQLVVTPAGLPADVRIVRSPGQGLDEEAILAVKQWRFLPGMKEGKAVSVRATVVVTFKIL